MSRVDFTRNWLKVLEVRQHGWARPPTKSACTPWWFVRGSKVIGKQETTLWCWGLAHATCRPRWKICNLRYLPLPVDQQLSPRGAKVHIESAVKIPSGFHGSLGGHGRRREHQDMALLASLVFTCLPIAWYSDPWERKSKTAIDSCHSAGRSAHPSCVREISPRSKRSTQHGDKTSRRCQFFDKIGQSAETRGSGKSGQGLPDANQGLMFYSAGGPGKTRRCREDVDEFILSTSVSGQRGPTERTVLY